MAAPLKADWLAVEGDYRAGAISIQALADKHGVSEGAVRQQAKKRGWARNPSGVKAERVKAGLAAGATGRVDEPTPVATEATLAAEAQRDIRVMQTAATFFETVLTTVSEQFPDLKNVSDQKKSAETATLASTMYRRLRGLEDKPAGKSIEDLLRDLG